MKLLISDLDGTLFDEGSLDYERRCSKKNLDAVKKWISSGNRFAVATARSLTAKMKLEEQLGVKIDFIGSNGVELLFADGTYHYQGTPIHYFFEVSKWLNDHQIDATAVTKFDGKWLISAYHKYPEKHPDRYRYFIAEGEVIEKIDERALCPYVGVFVHQDSILDLKQSLQEVFGDVLDFVCADIDDIDIVPKGVSKGFGVKMLYEKLGLSLEDVIVVGDSENDVSMFEQVKYSYCMSNSETSVQQKAAFTTNSVSDVIDEWLNREGNRDETVSEYLDGTLYNSTSLNRNDCG